MLSTASKDCGELAYYGHPKAGFGCGNEGCWKPTPRPAGSPLTPGSAESGACSDLVEEIAAETGIKSRRKWFMKRRCKTDEVALQVIAHAGKYWGSVSLRDSVFQSGNHLHGGGGSNMEIWFFDHARRKSNCGSFSIRISPLDVRAQLG